MEIEEIRQKIYEGAKGRLTSAQADQVALNVLMSNGGISPEDVFDVTVAGTPDGLDIQLHIDFSRNPRVIA